MPARSRGVAHLKTLAAVRGSGVHSGERHVHQFQLALLELEKTRRLHERQAALGRLRELDDRLAEIDALIRRDLEAAGAAPVSAPSGERGTATTQRRTLRY